MERYMREKKRIKTTVLLTDGFETVEALAVADVLKRAGIKVEMVSVTGNKIVTSAQNISVVADYLLEEADVSDSDLLFLPGGSGYSAFLNSHEILDLLRKQDAAGKRIAAICAAPSVLGRIELLRGKKAICFPGFEEFLKGAMIMKAPVRTITDGNITTSRGMGTSIDLGLELVKVLIGEDESVELARSIQYDFFYV